MKISYNINSRELIKLLRKDNWEEVACKGDHHQFKHPTKKGRVTVIHPCKHFAPKTLKSVYKQAGWL